MAKTAEVSRAEDEKWYKESPEAVEYCEMGDVEVWVNGVQFMATDVSVEKIYPSKEAEHAREIKAGWSSVWMILTPEVELTAPDCLLASIPTNKNSGNPKEAYSKTWSQMIEDEVIEEALKSIYWYWRE